MDDNLTWSLDLRSPETLSEFTANVKAKEIDGGNPKDIDVPSSDQAYLLSLPAELRIPVYQHLLQTRGTPNRHLRRRERNLGTRFKRGQCMSLPVDNLMLTCRQLYTEISGLVHQFATIHVQRQIQLGSQYTTRDLPKHLHAPFWHVPARLRTAQNAIGRWDAFWGDSYSYVSSSFGTWMPTVPIEAVKRNDFHWRRLEMRLEFRLAQTYAYQLPDQVSDLERITHAIHTDKTAYHAIDDFMNLGTQNGLHVSVVVSVRRQDSRNSDPMCKIVVHGGVMTVAARHDDAPSEEHLLRFFQLYLFEGKHPQDLRQMVKDW